MVELIWKSHTVIYYYTVLTGFVSIHVTSYSFFGVQLLVCASMLLAVPICICDLCPCLRPCSCDVCDWLPTCPHWTACDADLQHCRHPWCHCHVVQGWQPCRFRTKHFQYKHTAHHSLSYTSRQWDVPVCCVQPARRWCWKHQPASSRSS